MDFMPGGQALQIAEHAVDNLVKSVSMIWAGLPLKESYPRCHFFLVGFSLFHNERDWIAVHPFNTGYYTPMGVYY